jgi:hypothetical protein
MNAAALTPDSRLNTKRMKKGLKGISRQQNTTFEHTTLLSQLCLSGTRVRLRQAASRNKDTPRMLLLDLDLALHDPPLDIHQARISKQRLDLLNPKSSMRNNMHILGLELMADEIDDHQHAARAQSLDQRRRRARQVLEVVEPEPDGNDIEVVILGPVEGGVVAVLGEQVALHGVRGEPLRLGRRAEALVVHGDHLRGEVDATVRACARPEDVRHRAGPACVVQHADGSGSAAAECLGRRGSGGVDWVEGHYEPGRQRAQERRQPLHHVLLPWLVGVAARDLVPVVAVLFGEIGAVGRFDRAGCVLMGVCVRVACLMGVIVRHYLDFFDTSRARCLLAGQGVSGLLSRTSW